MATAKKPATKLATKSTAIATYSYDAIEHGKLVHYIKPVITASVELLADLVKADSELDRAIIGSLFIGKPLAFANGSAFVKALNNNKAKGAKSVTKNDVKPAYDKLQAYARIVELNNKPLQALWNTYTAEKIAEREAIKKENIILEANGEKPKALTRVTAPTVNGILAMLKPSAEVDHALAMVKSLKTSYNHCLELKGKKAQLDAEKIAALIIANGGEI